MSKSEVHFKHPWRDSMFSCESILKKKWERKKLGFFDFRKFRDIDWLLGAELHCWLCTYDLSSDMNSKKCPKNWSRKFSKVRLSHATNAAGVRRGHANRNIYGTFSWRLGFEEVGLELSFRQPYCHELAHSLGIFWRFVLLCSHMG